MSKFNTTKNWEKIPLMTEQKIQNKRIKELEADGYYVV